MSRTPTRSPKTLTILTLGVLSIVTSFGLGIQTAGDVRTIEQSSATDETMHGDMNGDGVLSTADAIVILEIVQGYRTATTAEKLADPNGDARLTVDDALRILHTISSQQ